MSRQARGGLLFVACAVLTALSLLLAARVQVELRPLFVWAALAGAFGMLAGAMGMGRDR